MSENRDSAPPGATAGRWGKWEARRTTLLSAGVVGILLVSSLVAIGSVASSSRGIPPAAAGGCPSSSAIGNYRTDANLSASYVLQGNGALTTYSFSSDNESASNGVPGLIEFCVYPSGTLPTSVSAIALASDGAPLTFQVGTHQGFFSFGRGSGNPSSVPFDGAKNVAIGTATWAAGSPTGQTILLLIDDQSACSALYGAGTTTCFVYSHAPPACGGLGKAPSAVRIDLGLPNPAVPGGGSVAAAYEYQVANFAPSDIGVIVHVPSVFFHFPLSGGTNLSMYLPPQNLTVMGSGWSTPVGSRVVLVSPASFATGEHAQMTTENLAVMAGGAPWNFTLEFRWGWTVNRSGTLTSHWSIPNLSPSPPNYPSIFLAAPQVGAPSWSASPAPAGSYFGINLTGAVNATSFRTSVENLNGKELNCVLQTNSQAGVASFEVGLPMTFSNGTPLPAGHYLIHVHDSMGGIVKQVAVTVRA